jgi:hypothetical protein
MPHENLHDEPYWRSFDELSEDIKNLAEKNYHLRKQAALCL